MSKSKYSKISTEVLPAIVEHDDRLWTTSLEVAEKFGKGHQHVLRDIRKVKEDCSEEFWLSNFGQTSYLDSQGREQPMVEMTRGGFSFLAMSFTGKKAAHWKVQLQ